MANSRADQSATGRFDTRQLLERLSLFPVPSRYWVGFSGGVDSTALLVGMDELRQHLAADFRAIHFNHGLQTAATEWQLHCSAFCDRRAIPFDVVKLDLDPAAGRSYEGEARQLRYASVRQLLGDREIYLTAHHADDNAETFILNLMRGSGIEGLAAIPPLRKLGKGWVARPLLEFRRADLERFLRERGLPWLEDPSNEDVRFDRNYVRNQLIPTLDKRWPGAAQRLNQAAIHARNYATVLNSLLAERYGCLVRDNFTLDIGPLLRLEPELQANLLRQWLRGQEVLVPPLKRLDEFLSQLNTATGHGARPELRWGQWMIKRHGELLWLHQWPFPSMCPEKQWRSGNELDIGPEFGKLSLIGNGCEVPEGWEIGPRKNTAGMRLHPGGPHRKLKELMREMDVPPWLRCAIPVLYWNGEVAAVGDWLLSAELQRFLSRNRIEYRWQPKHPLLCKLQSVSVQFLKQGNH